MLTLTCKLIKNAAPIFALLVLAFVLHAVITGLLTDCPVWGLVSLVSFGCSMWVVFANRDDE
jgi:hypothetical protein